jgi:hypothetical protein
VPAPGEREQGGEGQHQSFSTTCSKK